MLHHTTTTEYSTETSETRTVINADGTQTVTYSHSSSGSKTLHITVVGASNLVSVQTVGKQDPYVRFSLDHTDKKSFVSTTTAKNAGDNAAWNQNFQINYNNEPNLFVEVVDKETTFDEVIGFAAIPLHQLQGSNLNGLFDIYDTKQQKAGVLNLRLAHPNSQPAYSEEPTRGQSNFNEEQSDRIKSAKKKATAATVGAGLLGGVLAAGVGVFGKKAYDSNKEKNEEAEREEQNKQRLHDEEEQRRNQEREEFEQEKARFEQEKRESNKHSNDNNDNKSDCDNDKKKHGDCDNDKKKHGDCDSDKKKHGDCDKNKKKHGRRNSNSSDEEDAEKWNPVGTYAPGDRIKYHGNTYTCIQGFTSIATWTPDIVPALWKRE